MGQKLGPFLHVNPWPRMIEAFGHLNFGDQINKLVERVPGVRIHVMKNYVILRETKFQTLENSAQETVGLVRDPLCPFLQKPVARKSMNHNKKPLE